MTTINSNNNEQFNTAQNSKFGVSLGNLTISSIGQADDSVILSSSPHQLGHLLQLTLLYCHKYKVESTPEKTQLQVFSPPSFYQDIEYFTTNYLDISGIPLTFATSAKHGDYPHHNIWKQSSHPSKNNCSQASSWCCSYYWPCQATPWEFCCIVAHRKKCMDCLSCSLD